MSRKREIWNVIFPFKCVKNIFILISMLKLYFVWSNELVNRVGNIFPYKLNLNVRVLQQPLSFAVRWIISFRLFVLSQISKSCCGWGTLFFKCHTYFLGKINRSSHFGENSSMTVNTNRLERTRCRSWPPEMFLEKMCSENIQ